jgi:trans-aconitate methyltransferase
MNQRETRARLFHAQYQSFDQDIPFWSALAADTGDPILEMGCGTGRLVSALAGKGYRMVGLDHDAAMLERAKTLLDPNLHERVDWIESDLSSFSWREPVHLAIGALNTFAYLEDSDFCSALRSTEAILSAHGLIALDLPPFDPNPHTASDHDEPLDMFIDSDLGSSIELRATVNTQHTGQVEVTWIYDELLPDGKVKRFTWEQLYHQRTEDQLRQLIQSCDLKVRSSYGDYDFSAYLPGSKRLLLVIEK